MTIAALDVSNVIAAITACATSCACTTRFNGVRGRTDRDDRNHSALSAGRHTTIMPSAAAILPTGARASVQDRDGGFEVACIWLKRHLSPSLCCTRYFSMIFAQFLKQYYERSDEHDNDHPKREIPEIRIHLRSRTSFQPRGRSAARYERIKERLDRQ